MFRALPFVLLVLVLGCQPTQPADPAFVLPVDLARAYRDNPERARQIYTGQLVRVPVQNYIVDGREVRWSFSAGGKRPVLVFTFPDPPTLRGVVWIEGRCDGPFDDGQDRELPGYRFCVHVTDCRLVAPPTQEGVAAR